MVKARNITTTLVLSALFVVVALVETAPARVIYVGHSGPADFNNIQAAIDDANDGDEVIIKEGVYKGSGNRDINGVWVDGDYHLKSQAGRWDPNSERWVQDNVTSPCIDAGDPNSDWTGELWPHGKRINMGAYGGTPEASMSLSSIGNGADLNNEDMVNLGDFAHLARSWQSRGLLLPGDLNHDGCVGIADFGILVGNWLWRE